MSIKQIVAVIAVAIGSVIALIAIVNIFDVYRQELAYKAQLEKNNAVDHCLSAGQITSRDGNVTRTETIMDVYTLCMNAKGYSN